MKLTDLMKCCNIFLSWQPVSRITAHWISIKSHKALCKKLRSNSCEWAFHRQYHIYLSMNPRLLRRNVHRCTTAVTKKPSINSIGMNILNLSAGFSHVISSSNRLKSSYLVWTAMKKQRYLSNSQVRNFKNFQFNLSWKMLPNNKHLICFLEQIFDTAITFSWVDDKWSQIALFGRWSP